MPFRRVSKFTALLFIFVCALALFSNAFYPRQLDFISFWAAARLAGEGQFAAAYDVAAHHALQQGLGTTGSLAGFVYPPPFLILLLPFGMLPFGIAVGLWVVLTFFLYLSQFAKAGEPSRWQATAFPPLLANGVIGQTGFLTGAIFIAGLRQVAKQPFTGGLILGCLILKPQLGLLLPVALIAARQWGALAGAAGSALLLVGMSCLLFGVQTYVAMFHAMAAQSDLAQTSTMAWHKMISVYAAARFIGLSTATAWAFHAAIAFAAAAVTWRIWSRPFPMDTKTAILAAATMLISPYMFLYDAVILILPFMWLAMRQQHPNLLLLLWLLLLDHLAQSWALLPFHNIAPLVPASLLILVALTARENDPDGQSTA